MSMLYFREREREMKKVIKHFIDTQLKPNDSPFWVVVSYAMIIVLLLIGAGFIRV